MAPKPQKPKPKQDNRVLTPARRAVLYDQWLGGRSLEELSAKWRKPIHRINEALTMERAERKVAQAIKDSNERKANHEVAIEPPDHFASVGNMVGLPPHADASTSFTFLEPVEVQPIETVATYSEVDAEFDRMKAELTPQLPTKPANPPPRVDTTGLSTSLFGPLGVSPRSVADLIEGDPVEHYGSRPALDEFLAAAKQLNEITRRVVEKPPEKNSPPAADFIDRRAAEDAAFMRSLEKPVTEAVAQVMEHGAPPEKLNDLIEDAIKRRLGS